MLNKKPLPSKSFLSIMDYNIIKNNNRKSRVPEGFNSQRVINHLRNSKEFRNHLNYLFTNNLIKQNNQKIKSQQTSSLGSEDSDLPKMGLNSETSNQNNKPNTTLQTSVEPQKQSQSNNEQKQNSNEMLMAAMLKEFKESIKNELVDLRDYTTSQMQILKSNIDEMKNNRQENKVVPMLSQLSNKQRPITDIDTSKTNTSVQHNQIQGTAQIGDINLSRTYIPNVRVDNINDTTKIIEITDITTYHQTDSIEMYYDPYTATVIGENQNIIKHFSSSSMTAISNSRTQNNSVNIETVPGNTNDIRGTVQYIAGTRENEYYPLAPYQPTMFTENMNYNVFFPSNESNSINISFLNIGTSIANQTIPMGHEGRDLDDKSLRNLIQFKENVIPTELTKTGHVKAFWDRFVRRVVSSQFWYLVTSICIMQLNGYECYQQTQLTDNPSWVETNYSVNYLDYTDRDNERIWELVSRDPQYQNKVYISDVNPLEEDVYIAIIKMYYNGTLPYFLTNTTRLKNNYYYYLSLLLFDNYSKIQTITIITGRRSVWEARLRSMNVREWLKSKINLANLQRVLEREFPVIESYKNIDSLMSLLYLVRSYKSEIPTRNTTSIHVESPSFPYALNYITYLDQSIEKINYSVLDQKQYDFMSFVKTQEYSTLIHGIVQSEVANRINSNSLQVNKKREVYQTIQSKWTTIFNQSDSKDVIFRNFFGYSDKFVISKHIGILIANWFREKLKISGSGQITFLEEANVLPYLAYKKHLKYSKSIGLNGLLNRGAEIMFGDAFAQTIPNKLLEDTISTNFTFPATTQVTLDNTETIIYNDIRYSYNRPITVANLLNNSLNKLSNIKLNNPRFTFSNQIGDLRDHTAAISVSVTPTPTVVIPTVFTFTNSHQVLTYIINYMNDNNLEFNTQDMRIVARNIAWLHNTMSSSVSLLLSRNLNYPIYIHNPNSGIVTSPEYERNIARFNNNISQNIVFGNAEFALNGSPLPSFTIYHWDDLSNNVSLTDSFVDAGIDTLLCIGERSGTERIGGDTTTRANPEDLSARDNKNSDNIILPDNIQQKQLTINQLFDDHYRQKIIYTLGNDYDHKRLEIITIKNQDKRLENHCILTTFASNVTFLYRKEISPYTIARKYKKVYGRDYFETYTEPKFKALSELCNMYNVTALVLDINSKGVYIFGTGKYKLLFCYYTEHLMMMKYRDKMEHVQNIYKLDKLSNLLPNYNMDIIWSKLVKRGIILNMAIGRICHYINWFIDEIETKDSILSKALERYIIDPPDYEFNLRYWYDYYKNKYLDEVNRSG